MKTTIEIGDDLLQQVQNLARKEKTTLRSLTEQGLRLLLKEKQRALRRLPPLVTIGGRGLRPDFENAPWSRFRDEIYRGHGT